MKPLVVVAALMLLVPFAAPALAADQIAVVDMVELITKHPRATELQRKLEQAQAEAEQYAENENKALRQLQQEVELMPRNSPMRQSKEKLMLTQGTMLKIEIEWRKEKAVREYMTGLENLYAEIQRHVARYARERGIRLVLLKSDAAIKAADFSDYAAKVQLRGVVFSEPAMEITDQIRATFMPQAPQPGQPGR